MSKTDKTVPFRVGVQRGDISSVEYHNHSKTPCDYDPNHLVFSLGDRCGRLWKYDGHNTCGCSMCTSKEERKSDRRKSRHKARQAANDVVRLHRSNEEVD